MSLPPRQRYKATIAYDGSGFHGWQKQEPPGEEPLRTVQGVVQMALMQLLAQPINLVGASRTDSGVHADGQVAQFDAASPIPVERLADATNSRLPDDVEMVHVEPAPAGFNAIADVKTKQYVYRLYNTTRRPLCMRHFVYHCWTPLVPSAMSDAAARLVGEHDFAGFSAAGHGRESTVRTIHRCWVEEHEPEVHIYVEGSGFLYNMVRIIAGTLVEVGRGRFEPDVVDQVIASGDRAQAGPTLPASGLCLKWIGY